MTDKTADKPGVALDFTKAVTVRHKDRHKVATCPHCGHPMPPDEIVASLAGKQRAIYQVIARAGSLGISTTEIIDVVYANDPNGGPTWNAVSATVSIINRKIGRFGLAIKSEKGWGVSCYRLLALEADNGS